METKPDSGRDFNSTAGRSNSGRNRLDRWLSILLIIVILIVLGTIIYLIARPKVGDKFTEFYALGINSQAADYPTDFTLQNGRVATVEYGNLSTVFTEQWGRMTLGIVNHEGQDTTYTVTMQIDGLHAGIPFQGSTVDRIGPITLTPEEKWEQQIGIVPQHTGDNQKVEVFLYKDSGTEPYLNLNMWINIK